MPTNVIMPALGVAQETGKVLRWLKPEGAPVKQGEPLIEIETDKATVEIEAPASGYLVQVTAHEGDDVPVGQTIALIGETAAADGAGAAGRLAAAAPAPAAPTPGGPAPAPSVSGSPGVLMGSRLPPASPKARRIARELGRDIAAMPGSGPSGAVLAADVAAAQAAGTSTGQAPAAGPAAARTGGAAASAGEVVTVSSVWRRMAERTTKSWTTAPHFFLLREANASRLVGWREAWKRRFKEDVTFTDLLVMLAAAALRQHRRLNATWESGTIRVLPDINIGVAVATDDALVVPVIHQADRLGVAEIAGRLRDLAARAQAGKLRPEDVVGGTFTITNLGMYEVDAFQAVINPPQAAILAVGRIADRVAAVDGAPRVQPTMMLSLSCDHRAVDGARAAQFFKTLVDLIEEPLTILGGPAAAP